MTLLEFQALLARLSYKPGWAVHALDDAESAQVILRVAFTVPDSTGQRTDHLPLRIKYPLPYERLERMGEGAAVDFVAEKIQEMERHEFCEWFKLDGVPVHYPHGPGGELR